MTKSKQFSAKTLRIATPLIYHSDIPDTQMNSRPNLKKLVDGESRFMPPLTVSQEISTENAQEMYKRILVKQLKSTIKVWTTRDNILKSDCRKFGRNIKLITSPISVNGDASTLENDVSQWLVSEAGNKFCAIDKPYHKSQAKEPAMAVCIDDVTIFTRFNEIALMPNLKLSLGPFCIKHLRKIQEKPLLQEMQTGKLTHKLLGLLIIPVEHVVALNADNKFIAYSNVPPDLPKVKTKSNSKGVLMMNPGVADEAAWIVHTVPGFPKALRGYVFPPAEIQKGHLLICLTIMESQIDPIARTLRIATPLIYHSDIPDTQMNSRPNLKKLVDGESRFMPPLTVSQEISTESAQGLKVTIYSKGEKSRYEMYKRILVKRLKSTIKVWTTRDNILKSDCRKFGRNIKLITSPISVDGHASSLENDVSQWLVSEPGNKFCAIDKPYHKSQAKEPAMAVCLDDVTIFTRFNEIAYCSFHCATFFIIEYTEDIFLPMISPSVFSKLHLKRYKNHLLQMNNVVKVTTEICIQETAQNN
ncbi:Plancitoxin-1 [Trichinella sp. T8]|nr:Plancitoxin-1 [Trichinella sp. T8]